MLVQIKGGGNLVAQLSQTHPCYLKISVTKRATILFKILGGEHPSTESPISPRVR